MSEDERDPAIYRDPAIDRRDPREPSQSAPPLPADPAEFYRAGTGMSALDANASTDNRPALERLGPAPFRKTKFPLLGFLATVYEHVAAQAGGDKRKET